MNEYAIALIVSGALLVLILIAFTIPKVARKLWPHIQGKDNLVLKGDPSGVETGAQYNIAV